MQISLSFRARRRRLRNLLFACTAPTHVETAASAVSGAKRRPGTDHPEPAAEASRWMYCATFIAGLKRCATQNKRQVTRAPAAPRNDKLEAGLRNLPC
jgi:hypothetical protein